MTTTRVLFICETTTTATGSGVREVWEPDETSMAELGWQRIPAFSYDNSLANAEDASDGTFRLDLPQPTNGHGVVKPCPVHGVRPFSLCSSCRAWAEREATR